MNLETQSTEDFFIRFKESIDSYSIPEKFNYPFNYEPHPLCRLAAKELQQYLEIQTDWNHDFGIEQYVEGTNIGKMFGILLVKNDHNEIGYLAAFSGKLAGKNNHSRFVPPIVDLLCEESFYRKGEDEISKINHRILEIEQLDDFVQCKIHCETETLLMNKELEQYKQAMKQAKQSRDEQRAKAQTELNPGEFAILTEKLKNESMKWQYDQKQLARQWRERIQKSQDALDLYLNEIAQLKEERKTKSGNLQQKMFDQYQFLNAKKEMKSVWEIFRNTEQGIPPAGAGDCAGPKMLQYAYQHNMQPLSMAEFWWGQSPKSEIRKHGYFYPSCKGKCEPILGHMLVGLQVDVNPILLPPPTLRKPEIIFEDEAILVINKPAEYLSVPGKTETESVYSYIKEKYLDASGPLIVHRLDMSTSGLMLISKTLEAYHALQNQFMDRTVKKQYVALLNGLVQTDEGSIDLPLRVDLDNRPRQLVCYEYGKPALTHWKVIERSQNQTRIRFFPVTGRTHQLRVHAAHSQGLNCPIVGDDLYGQKADRLCLHAEFLSFIHPNTNKPISFSCKADF